MTTDFFNCYFQLDANVINENSVYLFDDGMTLMSGPHPHYRNKPDHNHFDEHGRWIGRDLQHHETPCRLITATIPAYLTGTHICEYFRRYRTSDYGDGEPGFAVYALPDDLEHRPSDDQVWLIDDAVRTPEGEPPARNVHMSPGPQTLLFPSDY